MEVQFSLGDRVVVTDYTSVHYGEMGKVIGYAAFSEGITYSVDFGYIVSKMYPAQLTQAVGDADSLAKRIGGLMKAALEEIESAFTPDTKESQEESVRETLPYYGWPSYPFALPTESEANEINKIARRQKLMLLRRRADKHLSGGFDYEKVEEQL